MHVWACGIVPYVIRFALPWCICVLRSLLLPAKHVGHLA